MASIEWKDEYSVNVAEIDMHHKTLINYINELQDNIKSGKGKEVILKILNDLKNYTVFHFSFEEKYMTEYNYPEYIEHKKQHNDFKLKVDTFYDDFYNDRTSISIKILGFLISWLLNHIANSDKKYSRLFNEKGLE